MKPRPAPRALLPAALFLAAAALVVAVTWPWALHWRGEFLEHWDPPFHAWKLEFMARRILAGDVLLSMPFLVALFGKYTAIAYKPDSAAQKPEKLYREKGLMALTLLFVAALLVGCFVKMPWLDVFTTQKLIELR